MDEYKVKLTPVDFKILESFKEMCEGLSHYLGNSYEIVLHSLDNLEHSAIKVLNGYHTGREEGAPITNLALSMLKEIRENGENDAGTTYFAKNNKGEPMKSTTIPIRGENGNIIGLLCMNFYLNTPFSDLLELYTNLDDAAEQNKLRKSEVFARSSDEMVSGTILEVRNEVFSNPSITASNKNKEIVIRLYENGFFNLKGSIPQCANILNISRNTVYLHLRNLRGT